MREGLCDASRPPVVAAGALLPLLLIGYFEGIDSERGLEWRCADSLSLREFLRLSEREGVPDHSWLSRTRSRLPLEVHDQVFTWVLECLAVHGLIKCERIGVDASTMEANADDESLERLDQVRRMLALALMLEGHLRHWMHLPQRSVGKLFGQYRLLCAHPRRSRAK